MWKSFSSQNNCAKTENLIHKNHKMFNSDTTNDNLYFPFCEIFFCLCKQLVASSSTSFKLKTLKL